MASAIFDSYSFVSKLKEAGMPEEQAKVLAEEHQAFLDDKLATKQDLLLLEKSMDTKIESVKADIIKWVAGLLIAQAALVATLLKLFGAS